METMPSDNPYAPPRGSAEVGESSRASGRDGVRKFGVLLLVDSGLVVLRWVVLAFWHFWPSWLLLVQTILFAALGLGLIRIGRKLVLLTFGMLLGSGLAHVLRNLALFQQGGMVALPGPLLFGAVNILPALLLLIGAPGRARFWAALVVFIVAQVLAFSGAAMNLYVTQNLRDPSTSSPSNQ